MVGRGDGVCMGAWWGGVMEGDVRRWEVMRVDSKTGERHCQQSSNGRECTCANV